MSQADNLRFQVQVLARCVGTALDLGKPVKVEVHFRHAVKGRSMPSRAAALA
jgi:hypothetical protein